MKYLSVLMAPLVLGFFSSAATADDPPDYNTWADYELEANIIINNDALAELKEELEGKQKELEFQQGCLAEYDALIMFLADGMNGGDMPGTWLAPLPETLSTDDYAKFLDDYNKLAWDDTYSKQTIIDILNWRFNNGAPDETDDLYFTDPNSSYILNLYVGTLATNSNQVMDGIMQLEKDIENLEKEIADLEAANKAMQDELDSRPPCPPPPPPPGAM